MAELHTGGKPPEGAGAQERVQERLGQVSRRAETLLNDKIDEKKSSFVSQVATKTQEITESGVKLPDGVTAEDQAKRDVRAADPSVSVFWTIDTMSRWQDEGFPDKPVDLHTPTDPGSRPVFYRSEDGKVVELQKVLSRDAGKLQCYTADGDTLHLTEGELISATLGSHKDVVMSAFADNPDQAVVMQAFLDAVDPRDPQAIDTDNPQLVASLNVLEPQGGERQAATELSAAMVGANKQLERAKVIVTAEIAAETDPQERARKQALLAQLDFAYQADGQEWGAGIKFGALTSYAAEKRNLGTEGAEALAATLNALEPEAEIARDNMERDLAAAGVPKERIEQAREKGLAGFMGDTDLLGKLMQIPDADKKLFGREMSDQAAKDLVNKFFPGAEGDEEKRRGWLKGILIALAILAASPLAVGTASMFALSGAMKQQ